MAHFSGAILVLCLVACAMSFEFGSSIGVPPNVGLHRLKSFAQGSGGPPSGTPPSGTPPSGTPPSGTPPSGTPPSGTPPGCESGTACTPPDDAPANGGPAESSSS